MQYFNLHTHQYTKDVEILELVNQYPHEFNSDILNYSIGIHPLFIDESRLESDFEILEQKIGLSECLAVGECGLDKRSETVFEIQLEVLERQLLLAEKFQKPVVIHCVQAFQELEEMKKRLRLTTPIIIHGFSKKEQLAKQLLNSGFYLSFGKHLLRNPELESVFTSTPTNRFFLETDMIEEGIREVYSLAAKYKKISIEALQLIIAENVKTVFKK